MSKSFTGVEPGRVRTIGVRDALALERIYRDAVRAPKEADTAVAALIEELAAPVDVIGGAARSLRDPALPPASRAALAESVERNARRLAALVAELRASARAEAARLGIVEIEDLLAAIAGESGDRVRVDGGAGLAAIADGDELAAAMRRLVEPVVAASGSAEVRIRAAGRRVEVEIRSGRPGAAPPCAPAPFVRSTLERMGCRLARRADRLLVSIPALLPGANAGGAGRARRPMSPAR